MDTKDSLPYGDYVLRTDPEQLDAPIRWSIAVVIERHDGEVVRVRHDAAETRATEEAVASSLEFGRQIVDGRHPDLPLP